MNATNRWAALAGVVAAAAALAVAEVLAVFVAAASSPLFAVGSFVIDIVPSFVKELVIDWFGTADKAVLLICLGVLVLVLAAATGVLEFRAAPWGVVLLAVVGVVATIAVVTRAEATAFWALPTIAGVIAGAMTLRMLTRRLRDWAGPATSNEQAEEPAPRAVDRRSFLTLLIGAAGAAAVAGVGARIVNAGTTAVNIVRESLRLPSAAVEAAPIPAGAELDVPGITPLISANEGFYRIDTALQVPVVDAAKWRLKITGMVDNELEFTFDDILALPLIETYVTLMCVSNEVGGNLVGNALWLGHPIRSLLERASPQQGADMVLSRSIDGWTASSPLSVLQDEGRDSILAVGMNGEPLPIEHGFPVRMVVPGLYGYVSATKWLIELKVTRFADETAYWTDRGWSAKGPVKTSSRIDVPRVGSPVAAGKVAIAGVAWAQHTGIAGVEVRIDSGAWQPATLAEAISADTWRQWVFEWDAEPGEHIVQARATDAAGMVQSGKNVGVIPDGAEGWHTISVTVVR